MPVEIHRFVDILPNTVWLVAFVVSDSFTAMVCLRLLNALVLAGLCGAATPAGSLKELADRSGELGGVLAAGRVALNLMGTRPDAPSEDSPEWQAVAGLSEVMWKVGNNMLALHMRLEEEGQATRVQMQPGHDWVKRCASYVYRAVKVFASMTRDGDKWMSDARAVAADVLNSMTTILTRKSAEGAPMI